MSKEVKNKIVPRLRFPEFRNDLECGEKTLGSLCSTIASGKDNIDANGEYYLYGSTGIIGRTNNYSHDGDFLLVARVGANAGLLTRATCKFGVTDNTLVISPNNLENIDFIKYTLEKFGLNKLVFGSGQPLITGGQLKSLFIYSPKPQEQQKIADCLSSLDELISAQNQQLEALKAHKKGLMQQLFPAEGETVPQLRFAEFRDSGEWVEKMLGELLQFKNGINASKEQYGKGIKFINVLDILQNEYITHKKIIGSVEVSDEMVNNFSVNYGDILFQRSSETQEEVGTANVYLDKEHVATFGGFVIRGKKIGIYDPVFLNKLLKTQAIRNSISSKSGGSTRFNIGQESLISIKILLPSLNEQQKIASCLSALDELITAQKEKIAALKMHKKGLMQGLFPAVV